MKWHDNPTHPIYGFACVGQAPRKYPGYVEMEPGVYMRISRIEEIARDIGENGEAMRAMGCAIADATSSIGKLAETMERATRERDRSASARVPGEVLG